MGQLQHSCSAITVSVARAALRFQESLFDLSVLDDTLLRLIPCAPLNYSILPEHQFFGSPPTRNPCGNVFPNLYGLWYVNGMSQLSM